MYLACGEEAIHRHASLSDIPFARITEIPQKIEPLTANNREMKAAPRPKARSRWKVAG
ncbi:MAG: hypothetical protein J0L76_15055 [Rhodobacterales bacterium]|nr:hypothetical protein [Rhodobacterales bacterium]